MNTSGARDWEQTLGNFHYSIFKDVHPHSNQMGWAAQVLRMPEESLVQYRWRDEYEQAKADVKRWQGQAHYRWTIK